MKATGREWTIIIERNTPTQDSGSGENVDSWEMLATTYAEKLDVSDSERVASAEVSAEISTRFRLLWSDAYSSVNPKDRIVLDERVFEIVGVKEIGRREGLEISAISRADQ
jgi:head-tail adaptor